MVPTEKYLQGLFKPHGGLPPEVTAPKPNALAEFVRRVHEAIKRIMAALTRPFKRDDYALCI